MNINDVNFPYYYEFDGGMVETTNIRTAINCAVHELISADCRDRQPERVISIKNRETGTEYRIYAFAHENLHCLNIWAARWTGFCNPCKLRTVYYN